MKRKSLRFVFVSKNLAVINHRLHWSKAMLYFGCSGQHFNTKIRLLVKHKTEMSEMSVSLSVCNALQHILPSTGYESSLCCSLAGKTDCLLYIYIYSTFYIYKYLCVIVNNIWQLYPPEKKTLNLTS